MNKFYVLKETGTFSDSIECLGLASIINGIFQKADNLNVPEILIEDKGYYFQLTLDSELTDEIIDKCEYFDFMPYVANEKDNIVELEFNFINYERQKEIRDKYYKLNVKDRQNIENPLDPNYDIIRMFANMDGYRKSYYNCRNWHFFSPALIKFIFKIYSSLDTNLDKLNNDIKQFALGNEIEINKVNALQDVNPDKGKGANQAKANGIKPGGQNAFWFKQLIRFTGAWESFVSRYFDKDFKTYSIVPNKISYASLRSVFQKMKPLVKGKDSIKMDILMIHLSIIELIKHNPKFEREWDFRSPADKISGFQYAYYKKLSQFSSAVTNIGFLGLPNFVKFNSESEGVAWIKVWKEHRNMISKIREDNSSNISMLQKYRQFVSASDFEAFFDFQFEYTSNLISDLNKSKNDSSKQYLVIFNLNNLEVLMQNQISYQEILNNIGFQAVANAIRNSTIVPIIHKDNKSVMFGLNQKLKIASRNNDNLVTEVSNFIQQYNETIMLKDYHNNQHKKYVTTEELQEFCKILDNGVSSKLIAGMLVAYGYAKEPSQNTSEENKENQND